MRWQLCLVVVIGVAGCAQEYGPGHVEDLLRRAADGARAQHARGNAAEAAELAAAVERIDPDFADLEPLAAGARAWAPSLAGVSRARRVEVQRPAAQRVLLYVPDRLLDLLDVISFDAHVGPGIFVDAHGTHALQASAGARSAVGAGLSRGRMLGVHARQETGVAVLAMGARTGGIAVAGTAGARAHQASVAGIHDPYDGYYQEHADYWSVGASATVLLAGGGAELHPVQLLDFLAGWIGLDPLDDDLAHTRGLRLGRDERELLADLARVEQHDASLEGYREARESAAPQSTATPLPRRSDPVPASPAPEP